MTATALGIPSTWTPGVRAPAPSCDRTCEPGCDAAAGDSAAHRASTLEWRRAAVERVIADLRERYAESLTLDEMARVAICSPYHFNRIFRQVAGVPPCRFLAAVRLAAAKRLLATTRLSVTEICYSVGYGSLGTFTTCFTQYVGVPPRAFRRASSHAVAACLGSLLAADGSDGLPCADVSAASPAATVAGRVLAPGAEGAPVLVGLFDAPIPRGRPVACTLARAGGAFRLDGVPKGAYYALAAALDRSADPTALLLDEGVLRGRAGPLRPDTPAALRTDIVLRPPRVTDPPILIALPMLLAERLGHITLAA